VDFSDAAPILGAVGMAEASGLPLDRDALAAELDVTVEELEDRLDRLDSWGLVLDGLDGDPVPTLLTAGRQFLRERGTTDPAVLGFLPDVFHDLDARRAVLAAGTVLVGELRDGLLDGTGVELARSLVPSAFAPAVTDALAVDLYAAAVALVARLSEGAPAACVAEEILAVELLRHAAGWLDLQVQLGELDPDPAQAATSELNRLFELFEDDDVLTLFDMREPADAAISRYAPDGRRLMGIVDQRLEAWFTPYPGRPATGHLGAGD
jgi:hypothetical protein